MNIRRNVVSDRVSLGKVQRNGILGEIVEIHWRYVSSSRHVVNRCLDQVRHGQVKRQKNGGENEGDKHDDVGTCPRVTAAQPSSP